MKNLVVNADDFGLTKGVNNGIVSSFLEGIVTSTSIMANGECFEDAVSLSKQHSALSIGVHLVLVEEKPVLPPGEVPSLIDKNNKLYRNYKEFLKWFLFSRIKIVDIEKELRAQLEKVLNAGVQANHIDSHQHLHIYPPILDIVLRLAKEYDIRWIRNSYDNSAPTNMGQRGLAFLARREKRKILNAKLKTTHYFFGAGVSGRLTENDLLNVLAKLPDGFSELMCHPGEEDETLISNYNHWGFCWEQEKEALLSKEVKQFILRQGIMLTDYSSYDKEHRGESN